MKKIFRRSQKKDVLGRSVSGYHMHRYGLPYNGGTGGFLPKDEDGIELMLAAAEHFQDLHVVTIFADGSAVNRYQPEGDISAFYLYTGNPDPEIEFSSEFSIDDWTPEQIEASQRRSRERAMTPLTFGPIETAAINWSFDRMKKKLSQKK